jgi:hypothetical protein
MPAVFIALHSTSAKSSPGTMSDVFMPINCMLLVPFVLVFFDLWDFDLFFYLKNHREHRGHREKCQHSVL